jgi:hypothetical protein
LLFQVSSLIAILSLQIKRKTTKSSFFILALLELAPWRKWKMIFKFYMLSPSIFAEEAGVAERIVKETGNVDLIWQTVFQLALSSQREPKSFHVLLVETWRWLFEFSLLLFSLCSHFLFCIVLVDGKHGWLVAGLLVAAVVWKIWFWGMWNDKWLFSLMASSVRNHAGGFEVEFRRVIRTRVLSL